MNYYSLAYSTNHKEIGPDYPQAGPAKEYDERLKEKLEKEKITGVEIKESKISLYINDYTGKFE